MYKRLLSLMLVMMLLIAPLPASSEAAAPALPEIGDVVEGFELIETRDYALMDATILRFEHQKTGAELFYIANDDTNRAFDLTFFTEAIDNTGLPHVFEHATIQGSKNYPGEQMFFNLSYQTYNTFMNAFTGQWNTSYPLASLSEKQLLKLAEFYTDACFFPIIMENERIFHTEAWRYRMETPEDDLTIEGTVYSEMLGAITLKRQAIKNLYCAAFPGSMACNESGGDPDYIPDMTWQALKDYHDRYYHPSNCAAYLYGAFEDYTAFLRLLDSYFSQFERREFSHADAGYTPITAPVVQTLPFPVERGSDTSHASTAFYAFVCPGLRQDLEQELVLDTLTDLFSASASDLEQRLQQALPYGSFGAYIETTGPDDAIVFYAMDVDTGDVETFKSIVDEEIQKVAENGFPQALVDSVAASLEISALLTREESDPVDSIIDPMVSRYISSKNPWDYQDYQEGLFKLDEWNRQGLYAEAISRWLVDNETTVLSTTYPEPGAKEAHDAETAEKLAAIKAAMSDEEIQAIVDATNAEAPEDHSAEYVKTLKVETVESLPEELKIYEVRDVTDDQGIRHIDAPAAVEGISQTSILLDAAGLAQEDIHWFKLYTDLISQLDTSAHTKAELAALFSRYLYSGAIYLSMPKAGQDGYHPYLRMTWIGLDDDLAQGYDLMHELVYDTRVDDPAKLLEQVEALRTDLKSSISSNPVTTILQRSLSRRKPLYAYYSYAMGLDYYAFLDVVAQQLRDDPDAVVAKLKGIQAYFNNRTNALTMCAGSEESIALNRQLSDAFLASLDAREITPAEYDFPIPEKREALVIDSGVQFNVISDTLEAIGLDAFDGGLDAVNNLVSDAFLVPLLRDQYGVYSPWAAANEDYWMLYAYRDPNIVQTFDVLDQLPDMIRDVEIDQETLDGYIMNAYSAYAMPQGALSGPASAALDALQGLPQERRLDWMRELKQVTPETVKRCADLFAALNESGARMTAGAVSAINQHAELYDAILNPFGTEDAES